MSGDWLVLNMFGLAKVRPAFGYIPLNTNLTKIDAGRNVGSSYVDTKGKSHSTQLCMKVDLCCFVLLCALAVTSTLYGEQASCNYQVRLSSLFRV